MESPSRRGVLAALAALLAGCGSESAETPAETTDRTPTATATATPEATPQDTATATATETATATPAPVADPVFEQGAASWSPPLAPAEDAWPLPEYDLRGTRALPASSGADATAPEVRWTAELDVVHPATVVAGPDAVYAVATDRSPDRLATAVARFPPDGGEADWQRTTDREAGSAPALDGDALYLSFGESTVTAFDAADGAEREFDVPAARFDRRLSVGGGVAYLTDGDDVLHALRASGGERVFRFDGGEIHVGDPPVTDAVQHWDVRDVAVDDDRVYVATGAAFNDVQPPDLGKLYALDPEAAEIAWTARTAPDSPSAPTPASALAMRDDRVYVAGHRELWAFDAATGDRLWATDRLGARLDADLLAVGVETAYATDGETVWAVDAASGEVRWTTDEPGVESLAVAGDALYVGRGPASPGITAFDAGGDERWRRDLDHPVSALALAHGGLYAGTANGRVVALW